MSNLRDFTARDDLSDYEVCVALYSLVDYVAGGDHVMFKELRSICDPLTQNQMRAVFLLSDSVNAMLQVFSLIKGWRSVSCDEMFSRCFSNYPSQLDESAEIVRDVQQDLFED